MDDQELISREKLWRTKRDFNSSEASFEGSSIHRNVVAGHPGTHHLDSVSLSRPWPPHGSISVAHRPCTLAPAARIYCRPAGASSIHPVSSLPVRPAEAPPTEPFCSLVRGPSARLAQSCCRRPHRNASPSTEHLVRPCYPSVHNTRSCTSGAPTSDC